MDRSHTSSAVSAGSPLERIEFSLPSVLESVAQIEEAAEAMALRCGFDEDDASNVALVTREAAVNAVKHGNGFSLEKKLAATLERSADAVTVRICDEGEGLDPSTLPDPLETANLLRASGRGIFLMRALVDEVHFRQLTPGTEITLIKRRDMEAGS